MYNSIPGASLESPWSLLVTFHSSAKSAPGCSQKHFFAQAAYLQPLWGLFVAFHSSAKSTPGCSQEHYLSTWPSQSTPWPPGLGRINPAIASSDPSCPFKNTLKTNAFSTFSLFGRQWTLLGTGCAPDAPKSSPDDPLDGPDVTPMGPNIPRMTPRRVQMSPNDPQICPNEPRMTPT